jgi:hypothetical protein
LVSCGGFVRFKRKFRFIRVKWFFRNLWYKWDCGKWGYIRYKWHSRFRRFIRNYGYCG